MPAVLYWAYCTLNNLPFRVESTYARTAINRFGGGGGGIDLEAEWLPCFWVIFVHGYF